MTRWLLRGIWRLYPRRWRARFGEELQGHLGRLHTGPGDGPRLVSDALLTLVRAWTHELMTGRRPGEELRRDVRLALRSMRRAPLHAGVVVATLALGVGANGAVLSVARAVLLGTLPYRDVERIVEVRPDPLDMVGSADWRVDPSFLELPGVEAAALYLPDAGANLVEGSRAIRVQVTFVGPDFFRVMGVEPLLGPGFGTARAPGGGSSSGSASVATDVVVLSHALWVRAFGTDPEVVGRSLHLSGHTFHVVGVLPADADFPAGTDVWAPMPGVPEFFGGAFGPSTVARVAEGVDRGALLAAYRARVVAEEQGMPAYIQRPAIEMPRLRDTLTGPVRTPLVVLLGAAGAILLLACLNLAGIRLSRAAGRSGEMSVRRALGAGRGRVARQLLVESLVLAVAGGTVGVGVAWLGTGVLAGWLPGEIPGLGHARLDAEGILVIAAVSILAGLAVGVPAAIRAARVHPLPDVTARTTGDGQVARLHAALIVGQVAVATVLALGAALLGRGLAELRAVPLGYDTDSVLTFEVQLPQGQYPDPETRETWVGRVGERLAALPGVAGVGTTSRLPLSDGMGIGLAVRLPGESEERKRSVSWVTASEGYFRAMGIPLLEGRPPHAGGSQAWAPDEMLIDAPLARTLFGDAPAAGRHLVLDGFQGPREVLVTGVVGPVRLRGRRSDARPVVWTPLDAGQRIGFAVRTVEDPADVAGAVRAALAEVDPSVPPHQLRTTGRAAAGELAARRALVTVSSLFGVAALVLLALGLYGLVAQTVASRRRELGIRLVLGAPPARVVSRAVTRALALVVLGLVPGIPAALLAGRLAGNLLTGVPPGDPLSVAAVVLLVLAVGGVAAWIPAARAGRIDPVESLRAE